MLAENLVDSTSADKPAEKNSAEHHIGIQYKDSHRDITNGPKEANVCGLGLSSKFQSRSLSFLTLLNPFVAEYQSDAPDHDEEYGVQSDDESVLFFVKYLSQIVEFFWDVFCIRVLLLWKP